MKKLFVVMLTLLSAVSLFAQDIITKKDGTDIKAKVLEITQDEVKYKEADNPDGPVFSIAKADILLISYANGTNEIMDASPAVPAQPQQTAGGTEASVTWTLESIGKAKDVSVLSGDVSLLRSGIKVFIENIDYDACIIEGKPIGEWLASQGSDFVRDWPDDQIKIKEYFVNRMAKKCKGMSLAADPASADYVMKTHILKMVPGHYVPFIPAQSAGAARIWGIIEVCAGGGPGLVLAVNEVHYNGTFFSMVDRFGMAFSALADYLAKLK